MAQAASTINTFLFLYTESSLHAGTGSTVSVVDLPIQRERTTQYPLVQGSGVKGALRSQYAGQNAVTIFGPDTMKGDIHAGAVAIGDAKIVLFPVQSLAGVFAYTTSRTALARLARDVKHAGGEMPVTPDVLPGAALITSNSDLVAGNKVVLEEFSFEVKKDPTVDKLAAWLAQNAFPVGDEYDYWKTKLARSLVILPDDDFRDFVVNSTEIATRVKLERGSKTVATGALWTEESLPSDCLLYSTVLVNKARDKSGAAANAVLNDLTDNIGLRIQLGGDETTGSGFVALRWL